MDPASRCATQGRHKFTQNGGRIQFVLIRACLAGASAKAGELAGYSFNTAPVLALVAILV